jgi:hypothetical protein
MYRVGINKQFIPNKSINELRKLFLRQVYSSIHRFFAVRRLEIVIKEETDAIVFLSFVGERYSTSETDATILGNDIVS